MKSNWLVKEVLLNKWYYFTLILFILYSFIVDGSSANKDSILDIAFIIIFLGLMWLGIFSIARFIQLSMKKKDFPVRGWKLPIYFLGWLGIFNLIFWISQSIGYYGNESESSFFGEGFHKRVYYWGWVNIGLIIFLIIFMIMVA